MAITDSLLLSNSSYTLIRKDRLDKFGGVAIFVKHGLKTVCIDLTSCFQQHECIIVDVLFPSQQYRFICTYNPPSLANDIAHTSCLCSFLDYYCNSKLPVVVVGDFNYPNIDWSVPVNTGSICSSLFLTSILQNGLTQLVNLPTRGNHCIDLVMVSDVSMMFDISPFVVSCDHSSVEFMVICPCNHPANSISYCRDISAANYPFMISFLLDIDWLMLQQSCSVDEFWNVFSMKLNECIERFVPLRIVSSRKLPRLKHIRKLLLLKKKWYHKDRGLQKNC